MTRPASPSASQPPPPQEAVVAILSTADVVRRRMEKVTQGYGVTGQQYNVLRILRGALPKPLPTLEIGERMIEQTPGITRLLDRLERKRLVARERNTEDRRQVLCSITPEGLQLLRELDEHIMAANLAALGRLDGAEIHELLRLLSTIRAAKQ